MDWKGITAQASFEIVLESIWPEDKNFEDGKFSLAWRE